MSTEGTNYCIVDLGRNDMLNGIFQRPYLNRDTRSLVKKKQDDESTASTQREKEADSNSKSKGLQYIDQQNTTPYIHKEEEVDWRKMRSQIQAQVRSPKITETNTEQITPTRDLSGRSSVINIAQIIKDFKNTEIAIGTPDDLQQEVDGYLSLIETQVTKDNPNVKLIKSNLKNASSILDNYISETLNKDSKVVENWVDALFLQQIDFKYNENDINPQFLVKFPEGSTKTEEKTEIKNVVDNTVNEPIQKEIETNSHIVSLIPQDKELKSLFIKSKKLAYAKEPEKAIDTFKIALKRADEVGDNETKSKIYYEVGKIYDDYSYFSEALKSYHQSIETTKDNNVKIKAHYSMAQIYDDVNQIKPALDHYYNSIAFAGEADNLVAQSTSLTKMGNIYTDMYDNQAMEYLAIADDIAAQTQNERLKGFVSSSKGNAYEAFGESHNALKAYSNAVKHYVDSDSPLKTAENYTKAADIMVEFSNISKAKNLLSKAQDYARKTDDINLMNEISDKLNSLELLS